MLLVVAVMFGPVASCSSPGPDSASDASSAPGAETAPGGRSTEFLQHCFSLIRADRHLEARALLEPVVESDPDWAPATLYLAMTYNQERRWETACQLYERVLVLAPDLHATHMPYGWCLYYLGRPDDARRSFETYLEFSPDYPDAIFALGLIDFDADDLTTAERRFRRVVALTEASSDTRTEARARARLADVYLRSGRLEPAREELERAIALDPNDGKAYFKLSRVLQLSGDTVGADRARQAADRLATGPR